MNTSKKGKMKAKKKNKLKKKLISYIPLKINTIFYKSYIFFMYLSCLSS